MTRGRGRIPDAAPRRGRRAPILLSLAIGSGIGLSGCAVMEFDGVLARQILVEKDPLMRAVFDAVMEGTRRETFERDIRTDDGDIPGRYWDGRSDPADLDLRDGGTALYNLRTSGQTVKFDVLLSSGPRDAEADPFADPDEPYIGPPSIYTCFSITAEIENGRVVDVTRDAAGTPATYETCDSALVRTLDRGASAEHIVDFDG